MNSLLWRASERKNHQSFCSSGWKMENLNNKLLQAAVFNCKFKLKFLYSIILQFALIEKYSHDSMAIAINWRAELLMSKFSTCSCSPKAKARARGSAYTARQQYNSRLRRYSNSEVRESLWKSSGNSKMVLGWSRNCSITSTNKFNRTW